MEQDGFNIAFVGRSRCGKSSTINALRGIGNNHPDAARVGVAGETTRVRRSYPIQTDNLIQTYAWDCPGIDMTEISADQYYRSCHLSELRTNIFATTWNG